MSTRAGDARHLNTAQSIRSVGGLVKGFGYTASVLAPMLFVGFAGHGGKAMVGVASATSAAATTRPALRPPQIGNPPWTQPATAAGQNEKVKGRREALSFPAAERFARPLDPAVKLAAASPPAPDVSASLSDIAGPESRKVMAVRSAMTVFGHGTQPQLTTNDASPSLAPVLTAPVVPDQVEDRPRPDLLDGVPEEYAQIVKDIARQEGVDVNLMLSIMHAENAGFDPVAVSPAGAIGLMQVMPATGQAFGAQDLTNPAQNIRAGARFLKVLTRKYRNPVLIASAYYAGERQVDVRASLPLIRETADYVTRVVGLYTNSYTPASVAEAPRNDRVSVSASSARSETDRLQRKPGKVTRVSSSMLVYSASEDERRDVEKIVEARSAPSGPVRIEKERQ